MKKIIEFVSLILAVVILMSCFVFSAHAAIGYNGVNYDIDSDSMTASVYDVYTSDSEIVIPEYVNGFKVISIQNYAFANTDVTSVILPNTLEEIGEHAFSNCGELTQITIPASVTSVGNYCFSNCTKLKNISYLANVNFVAMSAFSNCSSLEQVILSENITEIGNYSFSGCTSLEEFPFENIKTVYSSAFSNSGIKKVVFNDGFSSIDLQAFYNCANLDYVELPKSVDSIAFNAFRKDSNLVLGVYSDTYAHQYAATNHIDHMILDRQLGDVNFDGVVDVFDATEIQKFAAEKTEFSNEQLDLGDINHDGYVDVIDALLVLKSVVGKYDIPPIIIRY